MKAAVLGATGFVGRTLVPALAERMDVVAISRGGDAPAVERVPPFAADALEPESLRRDLDGIDIANYLVHYLGPTTATSTAAPRPTSPPKQLAPASSRSSS